METENKGLKAEFATKVEAKDLMNFKVYHNYTSVSGIITLLVGIIMLSVCAIVSTYENANISYILIAGFFGLFFTVWTPVGMWLSVKKQMKKAEGFNEPIKYVVTSDKIRLSQGQVEEELMWDDIFKVKSTGKSIVLYITTVRANVIPLRDIGEEAENFIKIARKKLRPFQVKLNDAKVIEKAKQSCR
ncbi:MAG: YcxB family protein [Lachnospira sp.]|nr:YcxB family protein [Lachnospira sp.]